MNKFRPHSKQLQYDYLLDLDPVAPERKDEYYCHMHNDYELLFFYKGNADYIIENQAYHLKKNDLLVINPMIYHGITILSGEPYERCVFNFSKQALSDEQIEIVENAHRVYNLDESNPIKKMFDVLRSCEKVFDSNQFEYLYTTSLYNILTALRFLPPPQTKSHSATNDSKLNEIIEYIHANPELVLNTQILSERFFVSKSWIDHNFKAHLKMSPKQYINQKKVLYAQSLILSGVPITEVFERCNYINYTTFYRQYKIFLGYEPFKDKPHHPHHHPKNT